MPEHNAIDIIKDASILTRDDFQSLAEIKDELRQTWETAQVFRTRTEMQVSVLKDIKFPTPDAKYWQAVREQNVMFGELVNLSYEYRKNSVEIRKLQRVLIGLKDDLDGELIGIEIEQKEWAARNMEREAHDRIREILQWSQIKKDLFPLMTHGQEDVDAHQLEALTIRLAEEAKFVNEHTQPADAINLIGLARMVGDGHEIYKD